MAKLTRRVGMQWISIALLLCCGFARAITDGTVFLERGRRGIVPCPLIKSCKIPPGDVDAVYWHYGSTSDASILISYFLGRVAPQNRIPEGVYDIDNEFNLVIENVTASNEGTYYFKLKPHFEVMQEGQVEVCDKVSPSRPYPTVIGCNQDHDADTCEVSVRPNSTVHNLTCVMEQVKPAVQLRWIRLFLGGLTEFKTTTVGSSLRNNTYSTSATIQVSSECDDAEYVCEAMGVAVGGSTRTRVRLTETHPTPATYDKVQSSNNPGASVKANTIGTVFLERGRRGIVPCPLIKSRTIPPENVVAMYWYYGSFSTTSMLIRHQFGGVTLQIGIPEGVYDIDNEFSLVIENVTASNEGTYYFEFKPHLKKVESGKVEVFDKVSPSGPYPTVIGCNPDHHDADECVARLYDSRTHNHHLTCVMEQVKPAVELRWFRLLGGLTELDASITVRPVVLPAYSGSSLRDNTYSTSASIQVAVVDDDDVYVCGATGVAVGEGTHMIVRFTKAHPTTAAHDRVQSSTNPGTMFVSADEAPPTANKPVEKHVLVIVLGVVSYSAILIIFIAILLVLRIRQNRKLNEFLSTSKMRPDTKAENKCSSKEETNEDKHVREISGSYPCVEQATECKRASKTCQVIEVTSHVVDEKNNELKRSYISMRPGSVGW